MAVLRPQQLSPQTCYNSTIVPTSLEEQEIAIFPLATVLFPGSVLPLHIFEDRYRAMMADALEGDRLIAMALLKPGWEKSYYGRPEIEPVVCVGQILSQEKLADGKYNLLLQGVVRARVVEEARRDARPQSKRSVHGDGFVTCRTGIRDAVGRRAV